MYYFFLYNRYASAKRNDKYNHKLHTATCNSNNEVNESKKWIRTFAFENFRGDGPKVTDGSNTKANANSEVFFYGLRKK